MQANSDDSYTLHLNDGTATGTDYRIFADQMQPRSAQRRASTVSLAERTGLNRLVTDSSAHTLEVERRDGDGNIVGTAEPVTVTATSAPRQRYRFVGPQIGIIGPEARPGNAQGFRRVDWAARLGYRSRIGDVAREYPDQISNGRKGDAFCDPRPPEAGG